MKLGQSVLRRGRRRYWVHIATTVAALAVLLATLLSTRSAARAQTGDWSMYLNTLGHTGYNSSETIINPSSAPNLRVHWTHNAGAMITTQPIVANGMVYYGSWDGILHAANLSDGSDAWTQNLGATVACRKKSHGVLSTPAVASVLINGVSTTVLFVGGGDDYLYALDPTSGAVIWRTLLGTQTGSFLYSSPTVFNNSVYIGISAYADCQHIQGKFVRVDAATGTIQNNFNIVPKGCLGGSMWTSPTIDQTTKMLYFSTGESAKCSTTETGTDALIELNSSNLKFVASWQIPAAEDIFDGDFGSSPNFFNATINGTFHKMVGLINKNGTYYAFDRANISAGPLWQVSLATNPGPSLSSSVWDGKHLYVAAAQTTINGTSCPGSLSALNPASGAILWQDCLDFDPIGPVTGVSGLVELGVGTSIIIVDATNGNQLFSYTDTNTGSNFEGPGSISNGVLYQGNLDGTIYAFGP